MQRSVHLPRRLRRFKLGNPHKDLVLNVMDSKDRIRGPQDPYQPFHYRSSHLIKGAGSVVTGLQNLDLDNVEDPCRGEFSGASIKMTQVSQEDSTAHFADANESSRASV